MLQAETVLDESSIVEMGPIAERLVGSMGTLVQIQVWGDDRAAALRASESALRALESVEARLSTWCEGSDLARLNAAAPGTRVELAADTITELERARALTAATAGAFDPGVGAFVRAWDLRGAGAVPSDAVIADLLPAASIEALALSTGTAVREDARLILEEGAFGKGAGLEQALAALASAGVQRARVDLGGQVAVLCDGSPFALDVADPRDRGRVALSVSIDGGSLATTGNSERGRTIDGMRIGHVLDPRTGRPAHAGDSSVAASSVSVWTLRALDADALSTALFVLGPESGLALAERFPDVEAVFLIPPDPRHPDSGLLVRATSGLRNRLVLRSGEHQLEFTSDNLR